MALILSSSVKMARTVSLPVLAWVACADGNAGNDPGDGSSGFAAAGAEGGVRCTYAYRASNEVMEGQTGDEPDFQLVERSLSVGLDEDASELLGELTFAVSYDVDEFEGDSISISAADGQAQVLSILYQLSDGLPQNQFVGGHGFTGLLYFTHPTAGGDYQAFCEAVR